MGDIATWVGSIGVVLTLVVTAWSVALEARSRRIARLKEHAQKIAAWYGPEDRITIENSSSLPVYEVILALVFVQGAAPRTIEELAPDGFLDVLERGAAYTALGPGRWTVEIAGGWRGMYVRPGCEIAFTDVAGRHWIRRASGQLEAIRKSPIEHYGLVRPIDFSSPTPA